ncbi:hypothetical protein [Brevundimonas sp. GCM10030266]|uniref:hypothetical protein n=1 Tax=Brevundimonas sp. GCM10030266 TaxID=3273386 RepID=UPI003612B42F
MKLTSLIVGVAAAALIAGAASAQDINRGQFAGGTFLGIPYPDPGQTTNVGGGLGGAANLLNANWSGSPISSWHALGNAVDNNGTAAGSDGASFTLTGTVSTDCAYYSGDNATETLNFGQIGIYASDNTGPAAAFTMVDDAELTIDTNLAGCNTANTVRIQKTDLNGLVNAGASAYDSNVFQANLPYSVTARYVASPATGGPAAGTNQTLVVATTADQNSAQHGAWKSAMSLDVNIPVPAKALVAGSYSGTFGVTISAGL